MKRTIARCLIVAFLVATTGCGGGGGSSPPPAPVTSTLSFPLRSGLDTLVANGETISLTANGTPATESTNGLCSGSLNETSGQATAGATFEGAPALSAVSVLTVSFSNCIPAFSTETSTSYYDATFLPLGFEEQGGDYGVFMAPPAIPNSVMVGNVGTVGTILLYTDSTKAVGNGHYDLSFVVEPDTATTAIVNLISKSYDSTSQLLHTEQDRYRITSTGALSAVSIDVQFATTSTTHLVFR